MGVFSILKYVFVVLVSVLASLVGFLRFFEIESWRDLQPPPLIQWWYSGHIFFKPGDPYPSDFRHVTIGASFSDLKTVYPDAVEEIGAGSVHCVIEPTAGPFLSVAYFVARNQPQIVRGIYFSFDEALKDLIWRQAIEAFGLNNVEREFEGALLTASIGSVSVRLDKNSYVIQQGP